MSDFLYLDLETIPSQDPAVHERIAATITPPGNITKAETIAAWEAEKKPVLVKDAIAKTSFDGALGHICCIGWAVGGDDVVSERITDARDEANMLGAFFEFSYRRIKGDNVFYRTPTIVGHNVVDFDIRFIWQRAIVLGVRVPEWFPRQPKPWSSEVFDTMTAWSGRNYISLDRLGQALGLGGKQGVDGSMVAAMWDAGRYDEIADYCRSDIELTRSIHRKMSFAYGEAA